MSIISNEMEHSPKQPMTIEDCIRSLRMEVFEEGIHIGETGNTHLKKIILAYTRQEIARELRAVDIADCEIPHQIKTATDAVISDKMRLENNRNRIWRKALSNRANEIEKGNV